MDGQVAPPDSPLSIDELEAHIARLAGQLNAAQHRWLALIAEFDRREGWQLAGARSCAHWLNWKVGLDLGAAREARQQARRELTWYHDDDGSLVLKARLTAEAGAVLVKALEVCRKTRSIPPALRRALQSRDRVCRFPGRTHTRHVDGHHIEHWATGGATKLDNLVLLCRFHHRLVHEGGVRIALLDDGALRFLRPDGRPYADPSACGPAAPPRPLPSHAAGVEITPATAACGWLGERMDYGLAIDVLLGQRDRAVRSTEHVSAETSR